MRAVLKQHPDTPDQAVTAIEAVASRPAPATLALRFVVGGDIGRILLPDPAPQGRADELWRHTCFEAFVGTRDDPAYFELNLSPSGQWAAYAFDGHRQGMRTAEGVQLRDLFRDPDDGRYEIEATFDLGGLGLPEDRPWRVGLSAVVEEASGTISYWALAHPPGKPDFHHPDAFAAELPPQEPA